MKISIWESDTGRGILTGEEVGALNPSKTVIHSDTDAGTEIGTGTNINSFDLGLLHDWNRDWNCHWKRIHRLE